ncbi:MAG: hypothetical protein OEU26_21840, partial [Candidatus Tectomicrobia bacterium]|nr:hypothetical protein [Candidatus Tectomicrobia bacterium]
EEIEQNMIKLTLQQMAGNVSRTARRLKIGRSALISRMKKYSIKSETEPRSSTLQANRAKAP